VLFYFDSSALAKAYIQEVGTTIVEYILKHTLKGQWCALTMGLLETVSIFVRKKNGGVISAKFYRASLQAFRKDFFENAEVHKVEATDDLAVEALPLIEKHSINATDAVVLRSALDINAHELEQGNELLLLTADKRLVTAAEGEGLRVINPEAATLVEVEALLAPASPSASE
jgi:predicted nucleic acid-binding protein